MLLALTALYPPLAEHFYGRRQYGLLFADWPPHVNWLGLFNEWLMIGVLVCGLLLLFREPTKATGVIGSDTGSKASRKNRQLAWLIAIVTVLILCVGLLSYQKKVKKPETEIPIEWLPMNIQAAGMTVSLKTEILNGEVLYQFRATPSSPELSVPFNIVGNSMASAKQFTVILYDVAGFQLCREPFETSREIDSKGALSALVSNEKMSSCSLDMYKKARSWNVNYNFPPLPLVQDELKK
jgi:hypothetical protein